MHRTHLGQALRSALQRTLPGGWLYLPDGVGLTAETPCVLVEDDEMAGEARESLRDEFPRAGLSTDLMEDTGEAARLFVDPPSDELLVDSFGILALCAGIASASETFIAMLTAIALRIPYSGSGESPPFSPTEVATTEEARRGVFARVFSFEIAVPVAVALFVYYFWRLARKAQRPSPPGVIWGLRCPSRTRA